MKKAFWLLIGIAAGLVIAKQLDENPKAQAVVDDAAKRAKDFGAAIAEGFRERENELTAAAKPAAKKAPVKKPVAAKTAAKPAAKTAAAKKAAPAKKPVAKKAASKQSAVKPTATA